MGVAWRGDGDIDYLTLRRLEPEPTMAHPVHISPTACSTRSVHGTKLGTANQSSPRTPAALALEPWEGSLIRKNSTSLAVSYCTVRTE
jgi:hypothetical protein